MKIDNFYFVVSDVAKSIEFYSTLLSSRPTNIVGDRWADWENKDGGIYFGIISKEATECKLIKGNNGVLGLYADDIDVVYKKCVSLKVKILYEPEDVPNSSDHYRCFAIEDPDGNKIEISYYDKQNFLVG